MCGVNVNTMSANLEHGSVPEGNASENASVHAHAQPLKWWETHQSFHTLDPAERAERSAQRGEHGMVADLEREPVDPQPDMDEAGNADAACRHAARVNRCKKEELRNGGEVERAGSRAAARRRHSSSSRP